MVIRAPATYSADLATALLPAIQRGSVRTPVPFEEQPEARRSVSPQRRADGVANSGASAARLTVNEFSGGAVESSALKRQIPRQAFFYDDVDNIARGRYERGGMLDTIG